MTTQTDYRTNSHGHLVPVNAINPIDLLRDDVVTNLIDKARTVQNALREFKQDAFEEISTFTGIVAEQYDTKLGGRKGNLTLASFDGKYKVMVAISDTLAFDERLHVAKQLIDECIHEWTEGSNDKVKALVEHAFQTDKQGNINVARIFGLMRMKFQEEDEKWTRAMEALKASIQVVASSQYLRLYERVDDAGKYEQICLDMAGL